MARWAPPPRTLPSLWVEANREMPDGSPIPGRFRFTHTPYLREILDCSVDRRVRRIVCRKSAQVGWTDGVVCNLVASRIDNNPSRMVILFPREKSAIDFNDEKLEPMITASPRLRARVNLTSRFAGNRQLFKQFEGGFLKFIASNAPGDVKSTSAPLVIVEEPDDCNQNVKGQGDSIKMAEERAKAYHNALIAIGGTPTARGASAIDAEMEKTDMRTFRVPCHHCGVAHALEWENVKWEQDSAHPHSVYGKHHPETAYYECPACAAHWNDAERLRNIRKGQWVATKPFTGAAGFDNLNEIYSPFPGSTMPRVVEKFLDAHKDYEAGQPEKLITFTNSSLGRSFEFRSEAPPLSELEQRGEDYAEHTIPAGGLVLVIGVDVQHNRFAMSIWAYGRGLESWLVYYGEEYGTPVDKNDPIWAGLDAILARAYQHESGAALHIEACSIDCGDGQTSDAVYDWVRRHRSGTCKVMAAKGRQDGEIFSVPPVKSIDHSVASKASRYGVKVHMVGTEKAKDLLLGFTAEGGRIKLCDRDADGTVKTGRGPGRMHWYKGVRSDFLPGLVESEVKIPGVGGRKVWTQKIGRANEPLDTTGYAEHAARALRLHLYNDAQWAAREQRLGATKSATVANAPVAAGREGVFFALTDQRKNAQ